MATQGARVETTRYPISVATFKGGQDRRCLEPKKGLIRAQSLNQQTNILCSGCRDAQGGRCHPVAGAALLIVFVGLTR